MQVQEKQALSTAINPVGTVFPFLLIRVFVRFLIEKIIK